MTQLAQDVEAGLESGRVLYVSERVGMWTVHYADGTTTIHAVPVEL